MSRCDARSANRLAGRLPYLRKRKQTGDTRLRKRK
jgi:hypothetical protein